MTSLDHDLYQAEQKDKMQLNRIGKILKRIRPKIGKTANVKGKSNGNWTFW
ncbi:MAG: hypothetical protein AAB697_03215 [Patescibacteria group bacterium]